ncbi:hypothetical protein HPB48_017091 [Haemaphysalis longicornis]|uniref:Uncharacterized protein n=1 Tax=Haemaphysalis longicornis TaxID=44386 RepID=A0A9J6G9I2_HAELO|nr:hypothetical protein HPB48_017091 [Haemaphysalis longicornis]
MILTKRTCCRLTADCYLFRYWKLLYSFVKGASPGPEVDDFISTSARLQSDYVALLLEIEAFKYRYEPMIFPIATLQELMPGSIIEDIQEQFQYRFNIHDVVLHTHELIASPHCLPYRSGVKQIFLWHLSWEFVQMYAPMVDRGLLEEIVDDRQHATVLPQTASLVKTSVQRLKEVTWLEDDTKQFLSSKLEAVDVRLWPSSLFYDLRQVAEIYSSCPDNEPAFTRLWVKARRCLSTVLLGPHRYDSTTLLPNFPSPLVTYDTLMNTIDVAASALASPVYSERGTAGMTFGGLGFLFLSALMRVLDKEGQYILPNGSMSFFKSGISPRSLIALEQRQRCAYFDDNRRTPGGTAIAAVEIAYSLFLERSLNSFQLNLTHELTDEKVFFMTLCRMTCAKKGAPWALDRDIRVGSPAWNAREQRRLSCRRNGARSRCRLHPHGVPLSWLAFAVRPTSYCEASECLRHVELLTHGLNRSIDPCQDFQAYVCSTWNPDSRFPEVSATALDDLAISWLDDLPKDARRERLRSGRWRESPLAMFQSCVRRGNVSSDFNRREFLDFLRALRLSWPEKPANGHEVKHILVDLVVRWELTLWLRVRLIKHPFVPDAWRLLLTHARASSIRLFTRTTNASWLGTPAIRGTFFISETHS